MKTILAAASLISAVPTPSLAETKTEGFIPNPEFLGRVYNCIIDKRETAIDIRVDGVSYLVGLVTREAFSEKGLTVTWRNTNSEYVVRTWINEGSRTEAYQFDTNAGIEKNLPLNEALKTKRNQALKRTEEVVCKPQTS